MNDSAVHALGRDRSWLKAIQSTKGNDWLVRTVHCTGDYLKCLDHLLPPEPGALLLIDSDGRPELAQVVRGARDLGWQYVIVVAAAPNWREAYEVLHTGGALDYWEQVHSPDILRKEIRKVLAYIKGSLDNHKERVNERAPATCRE